MRAQWPALALIVAFSLSVAAQAPAPGTSPGQPAMPSPSPSPSAPASATPAAGAALPPGTTPDTVNRPLDVGAREGATSMGPAIIVSGCLRGTNLGHDKEAFNLEDAGSAQPVGEAVAPQGIHGYRLLGSAADLRRHVGQRVEVIGLVQEGTSADGSAPLTLDTKLVRTTADKCSH